MLIIGLTGSIGMGKSTAAHRFRERGIAVFDADAAVHALYQGPLAAEIGAAFPGTVVDGKVDRAKLSAALVKTPGLFKKLEAIVHPRVKASEREFVRAEAKRGARMVVLEIPLLIESETHERVDAVVVVSASAEVQRARVLARPGMSAEKFAEILKRQRPDWEKRVLADFVVDTNGSVETCTVQVDDIIGKLEHRAGHAFAHFWA